MGLCGPYRDFLALRIGEETHRLSGAAHGADRKDRSQQARRRPGRSVREPSVRVLYHYGGERVPPRSERGRTPDAMFKHFTIRGGLTLTIAGYTLALVVTMCVGMLGLAQSNQALEQMYATDTAALTHLKTSSEQMLQTRLALSNFETLFSMGRASDDLLPKARAVLKESDDNWSAYLAKPRDGEESRAADAVRTARDAFVAQALEPEFQALSQNDFNTFHTIQAQTADALYVRYQQAIAALEALQVAHQEARLDSTRTQFHLLMIAAAVIAACAVIVGVLARTALVGAVVRPIDGAVRHFERIAAGDLTGTVNTSRNNEMGRLFAGIGRMQAELAATVEQVRGGSAAISHGAREIASGNADLSQRTEEQAASLQQTATSMEQLTSTVKQNAEHAKAASTLAGDASQTAARGGEVVGEVVRTMNEIASSSHQIGDIIGVIEGIAFQTNILALNAAVEAARAGDAGRGFAVVAGEVRSLAQRSASAAKEINALIVASAERVEAGGALVARAGATMDEVVDEVRRVAEIIGRISSASAEQSTGIEQINRAVVQMDQVTQQNAALVEQAAAAAASLEEQAAQLDAAVAVFRVAGGAGSAGAIARPGAAGGVPAMRAGAVARAT
jgi:methyl-accepting chemotaxis protein-1 (serine sensor receptor)